MNYELMFEDKKQNMTIDELHQLAQSTYDIAIRYDVAKENAKAHYFYVLTERVKTYLKLERQD